MIVTTPWKTNARASKHFIWSNLIEQDQRLGLLLSTWILLHKPQVADFFVFAFRAESYCLRLTLSDSGVVLSGRVDHMCAAKMIARLTDRVCKTRQLPNRQ